MAKKLQKKLNEDDSCESLPTGLDYGDIGESLPYGLLDSGYTRRKSRRRDSLPTGIDVGDGRDGSLPII